MDTKQRKGVAFSFRILEITFGIFLSVCTFFIMKDVEAYLFPVVDDFSVNQIIELDDGIEMYGTLTKNRDCTFKEMMVYLDTDDGKLPIATDFEFLDPSRKLLTRASVSQQWGPWKIFIPNTYNDTDITIFARHQCHTFYDTTTKLHEFNINKINNNIIVNQR